MADRKIVAKKDGRAFRTHRVAVGDGYYVDPDYELTLFEETERGDTGLLEVLELRPPDMTSNLPVFSGRWDEEKGANALDIDAIGSDGHHLDNKSFGGHHPSGLPDRHFDVRITAPGDGRLVFSGDVSFGLGFGLLAEGGIVSITGSVSLLVVRGPATGK